MIRKSALSLQQIPLFSILGEYFIDGYRFEVVTDTSQKMTKYRHRSKQLKFSLKVFGAFIQSHCHAFTDMKERNNSMLKLGSSTIGQGGLFSLVTDAT